MFQKRFRQGQAGGCCVSWMGSFPGRLKRDGAYVEQRMVHASYLHIDMDGWICLCVCVCGCVVGGADAGVGRGGNG